MDQNRDWAALFSAGTSNAGEGYSSAPNDNAPYLQIIPRTGDGSTGNDFRVTTNGPAGPESFVDPASNDTDLQSGVQEHIVAVFDQSTALPGTMTVYRYGLLYGSAPIAGNLDLAATSATSPVVPLTDVNVWVGRSQWPDSLLDGSVNELRIYSHALNSNQVTASFAGGPDAVLPEPAACALAALAIGRVAARRRR